MAPHRKLHHRAKQAVGNLTKKSGTVQMLVFGTIFAAAGIVTLLLVRAAPLSAFIEPESGQRDSKVQINTDNTASNGQFIRFEGSTGTSAKFQTSFGTAADFYNNFDYGYGGHFAAPGETVRPDSWLGDHDVNCGGDGTYRTLHIGQTRDDPSESFYWCAVAGDPRGGHLMMSYLSLGMSAIWASPKNYYTGVKKVCWDMNYMYSSGRRAFDVVLAARSDIEANNARNGRIDLAFSPPGYQDLNSSSTGVIPTDASLGFEFFGGWFTAWRSATNLGGVQGPYKPGDRALRRLCASDNGNNTITMTQQRDSGTQTATVTGSFPTGEVRVVFEDLDHNPPKDFETYDPNQNTWHIDDILVQ